MSGLIHKLLGLTKACLQGYIKNARVIPISKEDQQRIIVQQILSKFPTDFIVKLEGSK